MSDRLEEILFKLRTFREVEHNDNQWSTEFVYSLDEAKQALQSYIDTKINEARIEELEKQRNIFNDENCPHCREMYNYRYNRIKALNHRKDTV